MRSFVVIVVVVSLAQGCHKRVVRQAPDAGAPRKRPAAVRVRSMAQTFFDQANAHHQAGRSKEAEAMLEGIVQRAGDAGVFDRMKAREFLGRIYTEAGRFEEAERILKLAAADFERLRRERSYGVACPYQALGALYAHTGRQPRAARAFVKAADLEPHSEKMQYDAALESMVAGDFLTALKYVDRALVLARNPRDTTGGAARDLPHRYRVLRGFILLPLRRYKEAGVLFKAVLSSHAGDPGARAGLGHLDIVARKYPAAMTQLRAALKGGKDLLGSVKGGTDRVDSMRDPTRVYGWLCQRMASLGLGWVAANRGRHVRALGYFQGTLAHRPSDMLALLGKGNSLNALAKLDEAEALFARLKALYPKNPYVLAESALVQLNKNNHAAAEAGFKKAARLGHKRYTCPYEGLGMVYMRRGQLDRAKKNFKRAIARNPDMEYKKYNGLARIYIKEGRLAQARRLLKKSMTNYPHDDEARKLLASLDGKGTGDKR